MNRARAARTRLLAIGALVAIAACAWVMLRDGGGLPGKAPIVAFPYGGDHSYWHDRADGSWGRYVTDEVIPEVGEWNELSRSG